MQNNNYQYRSDPYVEIAIRIGIVIVQIYFILNIYTSIFNNMPDYKIDKVDAVNWIMPFNLVGFILTFFNDRIKLPVAKKFPFLNTAISSFSRYIVLLSGFLSITTTILFYFSEYRDILVEKVEIVFVSMIPLALVLTFFYLYYKKKLK